MSYNREEVHRLLKKYWGYTSFRTLQEEVIQSVLEKRDTLALMPTGGGKSLCFQIPALCEEGLCLVITPLISLMKDQVAHLNARGIPALAVHSGMSFREVNQTFENALYGPYKFLYLSPERLQTDLFLSYLEELPVNLLTVDEAHCISQWGFDFRPAYLKIGEIREHLPGVPVLAITATATLRVREEIGEKLNFRKKNVLVKSFFRRNLSYSVFKEVNKIEKTKQILNKVAGSSIIFCHTRKRTEELAARLLQEGYSADYYHAGLPSALRNRKQEAWIQDEIRIIVCTNAFGMGIDKPDVRTVIHFEVPESPESYYQQAGRAGRDGKKSYAVLLYNEQELALLEENGRFKYPSVKTIRGVYHDLAGYLQLPAGSGKGLYFSFDTGKFCKRFKRNEKEVLAVLKILEYENHLYFLENIYLPPRVRFTATREELSDYEKYHPQTTPLIDYFLRNYPGIYSEPVPINKRPIAKSLSLSFRKVELQLKELHLQQILEYEPEKDTPQIFLPEDRVRIAYLPIDRVLLRERRKAHEKRIRSMIRYVVQTKDCRSKILLSYFNETTSPECGICDVCLKKKNSALSLQKNTEFLRQEINQKPQTTREILSKFSSLQRPKIEETLRKLLDEEMIRVEKDNTLKWKKD